MMESNMFGLDEQAAAPYLSLYDFCCQIRNVIDMSHIANWVCAEIAQVSQSHGHYYIELVQKSDVSDVPIAKLRCTLWRDRAAAVLPAFEQATGSPLTQGMRILAYVYVSFHEVYGLSGTIQSIDPSFTLGELEVRRRAILRQLQEDGVVDMNKSLPMPTVIKRIAVVSAQNAAGYGDFVNQLTNNQIGVAFHIDLFEAMVQGAQAEASIVEALECVATRCDDYDVVVIIRGGGSRMDLACFDSYEIALNVAQFPIPVIAGIGHERDHSIVDVVANTSVKTPTAVAEFIISHDSDFLYDLDVLKRRLQMASVSVIANANVYMARCRTRLFALATSSLSLRKASASSLGIRALAAASSALRLAHSRVEGHRTHVNSLALSALRLRAAELERLRTFVAAADPRLVVARGFSMTSDSHGKRVVSVSQIAEGDSIVTHLPDGSVKSSVVSVEDDKTSPDNS